MKDEHAVVAGHWQPARPTSLSQTSKNARPPPPPAGYTDQEQTASAEVARTGPHKSGQLASNLV